MQHPENQNQKKDFMSLIKDNIRVIVTAVLGTLIVYSAGYIFKNLMSGNIRLNLGLIFNF